MILVWLLQHMCLHRQKTYTEQQVPFILWRSLLKAIKAGGVKFGIRWEYTIPVDAGNLVGFEMNVVNTNKICTSALLSCLARAENSGKKIQLSSKPELAHKSMATPGNCKPSNPMTPAPLRCTNISRPLCPWVRSVQCISSMTPSTTLP